jgi:hypothetical protein
MCGPQGPDCCSTHWIAILVGFRAESEAQCRGLFGLKGNLTVASRRSQLLKVKGETERRDDGGNEGEELLLLSSHSKRMDCSKRYNFVFVSGWAFGRACSSRSVLVCLAEAVPKAEFCHIRGTENHMSGRRVANASFADIENYYLFITIRKVSHHLLHDRN